MKPGRLICSAGHVWDPNIPAHQWFRGRKKPGDRCGEELSYDIAAGGLTRCRRVLREEKPGQPKPLRVGRPTGFPPQVWAALREIQMAQARIEIDYPNFDEAGRKYVIACVAASLRKAHAQIAHYVDEVKRATEQ